MLRSLKNQMIPNAHSLNHFIVKAVKKYSEERMDILFGTVADVRFSTEVSGTDKSTSTKQIAIFQLGNNPVELKMPSSAIINNGDNIVVAGNIKDGLFKALAYKNVKTLVKGKNDIILHYIRGSIFIIIGGIFSVVIIGIPFVIIGLYDIYIGLKNSKAYQMISNF